MKIDIKPMTRLCAEGIVTWNYYAPYSIYNLNNDPECVKEFLNGSYYAALNNLGEPEGFFCFGESATVPSSRQAEAYGDKRYLDIGLGMRPDLCGRGLGYEFAKAGIEFAQSAFGYTRFRLTVAEFNNRAQKVYLQAGFTEVLKFQITRSSGPITFVVMVLDTQRPEKEF